MLPAVNDRFAASMGPLLALECLNHQKAPQILIAEVLLPAGKLKQECTIVVVSHDLRELSQQVRAECLTQLWVIPMLSCCVGLHLRRAGIACRCTGGHCMGDAAGRQVAAQTQLAGCTMMTAMQKFRVTSEMMRVMA